MRITDLLTGATLALSLALPFVAQAAEAVPVQKGLVVHEWGVFRAHDDAEMANADARAIWDELPRFMYGHLAGREIPVDSGNPRGIEVRLRPLVFFHTPQAVSLKMRIDFPGGMPGVWWPGTRSPAVVDNKRPGVGSHLEWQLQLKDAPAGRRPKSDGYREVPKGHWIERTRAVRCEDAYALYGQGATDVDREKFLFYDGIFPQGKRVKITVDKGRVLLASQVKFAVLDVTVIDRRGDGKVRVARFDKLDAGAEVKATDWTEVDRSKFPAEAAAALVKQLVAAGLYKDEAGSLIDACGRELFETDGLNVFYRLPQTEYDRCLPITLAPKPESLVRVGLVQHAHCEPEFAQRVRELVKQLDDDAFKTREAAQKKLEAMGPSVRVHLARLLDKGDLSAEVRRRVEELIERWDAKRAIGR
jgi:hypothetical protein